MKHWSDPTEIRTPVFCLRSRCPPTRRWGQLAIQLSRIKFRSASHPSSSLPGIRHIVPHRIPIQILDWQERPKGIEPSSPAWQAGALPLCYGRISVTPRRVELRFSDRKSDVLTTRRWGRLFFLSFVWPFLAGVSPQKKGSLRRISPPERAFYGFERLLNSGGFGPS